MKNRLILSLLSVLVFVHCSIASTDDNQSEEEQYIEVSLRIIGQQLLLSLGDSSSQVLPIEKKGEDKYQIRFENEFSYNPESVASVIDSVIAATKLTKSYIVEFESCEAKQVVYSYEIGIFDGSNVLTSATSDQPKACYNLLITILKPSIDASRSELAASNIDEHQTGKYVVLAILLACVLLPMVLVHFMLNRKSKSKKGNDKT